MTTDAPNFEAILRRIDAVERNHTDLARSVTEITNGVGEVKGRVVELEEEHHERRVLDATRAGREESMQKDIASIRGDIQGIKAAGTKLLWIVGTAIVLAFVAFVIKGGLGA